MNKKKDILFVNSSLSDGGSERVMTLLANQFSKIGYNVKMILVREKEDTYEVDDSVNIIRFKYKYKNKIFIFLSRIIKLRKELKKHPYIIISFMSDINICTLIANIGLKNRIIVSERADPGHSSRSKLRFFLERKLYPRAYKVVLQTEFVKRYFIDKIVQKSCVIPNPISSNLPKRDSKKINNIFVAAGRLSEQKNFELLINSFNTFCKVNDNYNLVIYGEGLLRGKLENQVKKLKLQNKIKLPGYVKNVNELMKNCKIYISTSDFEGISNSMLEAIGMGIPSICTDCPVGGAGLVIENEVNGILVPIRNQKAIVDAMIKLTSDNDLYNSISLNAKKIYKKFSLEVIIQKWIDLIEEKS